MARVLVLTFSHLNMEVMDSFRNSFLEALVAEGNDVLLLRSEDFIDGHHFVNRLGANIDKAALDERIVDFDPELVFSFNHSGLYRGLTELVDAPIALWLVDGPAYLVAADTYKENAGRYHTFIPSRAFRDELTGGYGTPESALSWLPFCSDFRALELDQTIPISFVGTFFTRVNLAKTLDENVHDQRAWDRLSQLVRSYEADLDTPFAERLTRFRLEHVFPDDFDEAGILNSLSLNRRIQTAERLVDLGLHVYGNRGWLEALPFSLPLVFAFDSKPIKLQSDLEDLYNTSKLILSVSHAQARGGVPWRIFDAMSTRAVLLSDFQQDLIDLFPGLDLPTYASPEGARELAKQLLADDERRRELSAASRHAIENGHRFRHRLAQVGDTVGINLMPGGDGRLRRIAQDDMLLVAIGDGESRPKAGTPWALQVYFSDDGAFSEDDSVRVTAYADAGSAFKVAARIRNAPKYLRLDLGDWFSIHEDPMILVQPTGSAAADGGVLLDLRAPERAKDVRLVEDDETTRLICGSDPQLVFHNPHAGTNIEVVFSSKLIVTL